MLIAELMSYAATLAPDAGRRVASALRSARERELRWALDAGLGPLLHHATRAEAESLPSEVRGLLVSADLTARVLQADQFDTAAEIIDICTVTGVPVVLLKGISISGQCYPESHLRAMTDIDILLPEPAAVEIEAAALRRGFRHGPPVMGPNPHHREPLYHSKLHTKVELHTGLFQEDSRLRQGHLFDAARVLLETVQCEFRGRPVRRLTDSLQLAYIASSWTKDLSEQSIHPSLVTSLFDATSLLRVADRAFDWDRLSSSLDNELAAASTYVLIAYLSRRKHPGISPSMESEFRNRQSMIGDPELLVLLSLIEKYLVAGKPFRYFNSWHVWLNLFQPGGHARKLLMLPWRVGFPPSYPHRFNAFEQARRIRRWFQRYR